MKNSKEIVINFDLKKAWKSYLHQFQNQNSRERPKPVPTHNPLLWKQEEDVHLFDLENLSHFIHFPYLQHIFGELILLMKLIPLFSIIIP